MGEVADMILAGILCERCGVLVGLGVGHPRLCDECPEPMTPEKLRAIRQREERRAE